jgi:TetR/AcrR family transcriptional regulator, transcriptional repressor for nem operon
MIRGQEPGKVRKMRYPASQTAEKHEKILKEAARLFRERGFDGAGVAESSAASSTGQKNLSSR